MAAQKRIFVIGTGRSGTCWMGRSLGTHPEIRSFVEPKPVFDLVTSVAVCPDKEDVLIDQIFDEYGRLFVQALPLHFADKSHPALWIAERLASRFADSLFIAMLRDVEPTVASMLRHDEVRAWCERWESYPVPNRFLGITEENLSWYSQACIPERCTARWHAHRNEILRLGPVLGDRMLTLRYEDLVSNGAENMAQVARLLGLRDPFPEIGPCTESLYKWKSQLDANTLSSIDSALAYLGSDEGVFSDTRRS